MKTVAALVLLCCGCAATPEKSPRVISWSDAVSLIKSGKVDSVLQSHNLKVALATKDGLDYITTEPSIDAVLRVVEEIDPEGKQIKYGTE